MSIRKAVERAGTIREAVGLAIGAASTAWETLEGAGVFDSTYALEICHALEDRIEAEIADAACGNPSDDDPRRFILIRKEDVTGVSGTGVVVWGVVFPDGTATYRWNTPTATTCVGDSIDDVIAIHGHNGATELVWIDPPFFAKGAVL